MHNGSAPQWPGGGRGRGFAPGRGRGAWAQVAEERPGGGGSDRSCFRCGAQGYLAHNCRNCRGPGPPSNVNNNNNNNNNNNYVNGGDQRRQGSVGGTRWGDVPHVPQTNGHAGHGHRNRVSEGCFKCGRDGHRARECTSSGVKVAGSSRSCGRGELEQRYDPEESLEENLYDRGVSSGINFSKFRAIPVKVTGTKVPDKIESFAAAGLAAVLLDNIARSRYATPTPIQEHAIPMILAGRDVMACAQTGSGKTAAFLLPIIQQLLERGAAARPGPGHACPEVVVMSPTRELAGQIKDEARKFCNGSSIRCVAAYGGTSVNRLADKLEEGCNILVATPGRLVDFFNRGKVSFCQVKFLVLDEADRMLDMGFKEEMYKILHNEDLTSHPRQTLLFSATYPEDIQKIAQNYLDNYLFLAVGEVGGACSDVEQTFLQVSQFEKREKLLEILEPAKTLVFVENKKTADFIASYLCQTDHAATSIHGDRLQPEREAALKDFKSDRKPILVATAVAARGLDIRGVAHVINYDLPKTVEEYVHRIGRTGRLGNTGRATSFYDERADSGLAAGLLTMLLNCQQVVPNWLEKEAKNNPMGHFGGQGGRFGAKDIRPQSSFLPSKEKPTEQDEGWDPN